jgi:antitoxin component of MazEF toxin-antitoxin module
MKPRVHKGGKPGQETFYLNIPREIVTSLDIKPDDEFELKVETKDGEITLCYKRVKRK